MSNRGTDNFAEARQFVHELFTLECANVHAIWHEYNARQPVSAGTDLVDEFETLDRGLNIKARGCAGHNDQTGGSQRRGKPARIRRGIDDRVFVACGDLIELANPVRNRLVDEGNLVNWKFQLAGLGPMASRTLRVGVNQGDTVSSFVQLGRNGNRQGGLPNTTFTLRYSNYAIHWLGALYPARTVSFEFSHINRAEDSSERRIVSKYGISEVNDSLKSSQDRAHRVGRFILPTQSSI